MRGHIANNPFDRAIAGVDEHPLGFGNRGVDTAHFADMNEAVVGDVIDRHRDFVGMAGEHDSRRAAFVQHGHAISVGVREGFIGKLFGVVQPDALAAHFMADRAGGVDEGPKKVERLFTHARSLESEASSLKPKVSAPRTNESWLLSTTRRWLQLLWH